MIETTNNKLSYTVGMTAVFPFPIRFFEPEDIHCYLLGSNDVSTELMLGTDFSIETKENYEHGANITLLMDPLPDGQTFTIVREMAITQGVSLPNTGKLPTLSLEKQLDRQIMICQQLKEAQTRTVKLPITSTEDPANYLDLAIDARAGAETAQGLAEGFRNEAEGFRNEAENFADSSTIPLHNVSPNAHPGTFVTVASKQEIEVTEAESGFTEVDASLGSNFFIEPTKIIRIGILNLPLMGAINLKLVNAGNFLRFNNLQPPFNYEFVWGLSNSDVAPTFSANGYDFVKITRIAESLYCAEHLAMYRPRPNTWPGNPGGVGDRTAIIAVTSTGDWINQGDISTLVDGIESNNLKVKNVDSWGCSIIFDFGAPRYIDRAIVDIMNNTGTIALWRWDGSDDGINWSKPLSEDLEANKYASFFPFYPSHVSKYRYYRMAGVGGLMTLGASITEVRFDIDDIT